MTGNRSKRPLDLVLVTRLGHPLRSIGSTLMRGRQLSEITRPHLAGRVAIRTLPLRMNLLGPALMTALASTIPRGAVVIFVKFASIGLTEANLAPIRRRASAIGLDSVDMPLSDIDLNLYDFHVAASHAAEAALRARLDAADKRSTPVEILHHHADPRLNDLSPMHGDVFRCCYLGAAENATIPDALASDVDLLPVRYSRDMPAALRALPAYGLHWGVRPAAQSAAKADKQVFKPFTKGFTAAQCGACILVNRDVDDAERLLGADYPFLVAPGEAAAVDGFARAKDAYGGPEWSLAQDRMRSLMSLVQPEALAKRLEEIVLRAAG